MTGFGFAIFLMGFFPMIIGVKSSSVLVTTVGLAVIIYLLIPLIRYINWKILAVVVAGLLVGTPIGVTLLVRLNEPLLMIGLGLFLILYLIYDVFIRSKTDFEFSPFAGFIFGLLGGGFGGAFNTSGPPVVVYLSSLNLDKHAAKATILAYITLGTIYKLGILIYNDLITADILKFTAVLVIPSFIGMLLGKSAFSKISTLASRRVTQAIIATASVLTILKGFGGS